MSKTWECWTLDSEEIEHVFNELYPEAESITEDEMEAVARRFKDAVAVMLEGWEETLGDCIRIEIKSAESPSEEQVLRIGYPDIFDYLDNCTYTKEDIAHIRTSRLALARIKENYEKYLEHTCYQDAMFNAIQEEV